MRIYKVTIIWDDGQKETYDALTENMAQQIIDNYKLAFGSQIAGAGAYGKAAQGFIRKGVRKCHADRKYHERHTYRK